MTDKQALLTEFAACMPEVWVGPHGRDDSGVVRLDLDYKGWMGDKMQVYVRLENDLLEAPALVAILDWLKVKGYLTEIGDDELSGDYFILDSKSLFRFNAQTRIECAVKAMVYVRSLEK